jgi:hypothetical protein
MRSRIVGLMMVTALVLGCLMAGGEPVAVRHIEGVVHGFLVLRTLDGSPLADGDLIQVARGTRVTTRLTFHFRDGSLHDETAVFSQRGHFGLISDHLVQRGPSFPQPLDISIDAAGNVKVHYTDGDGKSKDEYEHLTLPADVANGLVFTMLKNVDRNAPPKSLTLVAATPKPRLVKLAVIPSGEERFVTGGESRLAIHYVLKVEIGGLSGLIAPLIGKQPPDSHIWILGGEAPTFVRSEQPLYFGGPVWRIELAAPAWPQPAAPYARR